MPGMTWHGVPGPERHAPQAASGRDAALGAVVVVLTVGVFAAVADHGTRTSIQRLDDAWLRLMVSGRALRLSAIAKVFNLLGLVYVTLPARMVVAGVLVLRRRWWHLAAFTAAVVLSEVLIGVLKGIYERARPCGSLVVTTGASFPSGHAVAASATVVAAVIALVPSGRLRAWWAPAAVAFSVLMGLSCSPGWALPVGRCSRGPARDVVRRGDRADGRPDPAARGEKGGRHEYGPDRSGQ
jgi:hypothetical protein